MSTVLTLLAIFLVTLYVYFKWTYKYWKNQRVTSPPDTVIPFGNFKDSFLGKQGNFALLTEFYKTYKAAGHRFIGLYIILKPIFVPLDLNIIKSILIKDHQSFMDRGIFHNEKDDPLSGHLFSLEGSKWQILRAKLSPTFTSGKMKMMFLTIQDVGVVLQNYVDKMSQEKTPIEIKEVLAKYSTDIIGSCAFGLECNSFVDPNSEFRKYGRQVFQTTFMKTVRRLFVISNHYLAKKLHIKIVDKDLTIFFMGAVRNTVEYREKNNIDRNDFMKLLIELKNGSSALGNLTMEEIAAQAFLFFLAGFETSSTTMTFCLYELTKNEDIQNQVRDEIRTVLAKYNNEITYEAVKEMKLLQSVIDETLRMYPPVPQLNRVCTKRYQVPDSDVILEKGQSVFIPVYGIHYDPEYFPNPEKFDATRFLDENKNKIPSCAFLPFGDGPRNCIGLRFGLLQTKVGLISILKDFRITLNEKTPAPIRLNPLASTLSTAQKIYVNAECV